MRILAIETSCDETAIALIEAKGGLKSPEFKIIKNLVASQIKIHRPFGGVVPNLAKREHLKNLPILWKRMMNNELRIRKKKTIIHNSKFIIPDMIAVTVGPGLEPALWTGITFAKQMYADYRRLERRSAQKKKLELLGVSHLDGHLYSFLLNKKTIKMKHEARKSRQKSFEFRNSNFEFPAIALLVSGGHTILLKMDSLTKYKKLGETVDDAVGEAFDKVARLLELSYPGGPEIEKLAKFGNPNAINFPRPMINQKNYNFSFSGLKTSVLYYLRDQNLKPITYNLKPDIAASFQKAAFDVLIKKTLRAAEEFGAKSIMISGGVSANKTLAKEFKRAIKSQFTNFPINHRPILAVTKFPTDNAAMIAAAAYINYLRKKKYKLVANGNLGI